MYIDLQYALLWQKYIYQAICFASLRPRELKSQMYIAAQLRIILNENKNITYHTMISVWLVYVIAHNPWNFLSMLLETL